MKEYRNSIRSRRMIKAALVELLKTEDISKVTVKMIVDMADLSRNTFYAHYQDVYSIIEELQAEVIDSCMKYLDDIIESKVYDETNTLQFFLNITSFVTEHLDEINVLLLTDKAGVFISKIKNLLISRVIEATKSLDIKNLNGYMLFLDILFCGAIDLIRLYIDDKISFNLNDVAYEVNRIFQTGYKLYL